MMMNHFPQRTGKKMEIPVDIFHPKKGSHEVREFVSEWWGVATPFHQGFVATHRKEVVPHCVHQN